MIEELVPGVYLRGLFLEVRAFDGDAGTRYRVTLAAGTAAYSVYLSDPTDYQYFGSVSVGDVIMIKARPYVSEKGRLSWASGEVVLCE